MEIFGYIASIFIGISLGLIGGGGSILAVPVLVYLFGIDPVLATAYSLFIVGITSVVGSLSYFRNSLVDVKTALLFGIPSIIAVTLTRAFLLPALPDELFSSGSFTLTKSLFTMILFAGLMVLAAYKMIHKSKQTATEELTQYKYLPVLIQGVLVGMLTGLVGAGGGFLIIPALVGLLKIPMKKAIGTSLLIISANSLIGFLSALNHSDINWIFLIIISSIAILGILIGFALSKKVDGKKLKPAFGWFILIMGSYILLKELFF